MMFARVKELISSRMGYPKNYSIQVSNRESDTSLSSKVEGGLTIPLEKSVSINDCLEINDAWLATILPSRICGRPISEYDIISQFGRIFVLGIVPYGVMLNNRKPVDPVLPIICSDSVVFDNDYSYYMEELVCSIQQWVESHLDDSPTDSRFESYYMHKCQESVNHLLEIVAKYVSKEEYDKYSQMLRFCASNPQVSLAYHKRKNNGI
jgi:hypothetical protein